MELNGGWGGGGGGCLKHFMKKRCKRQIKEKLRIKKKSDRLHVKWKRYDHLFNS